MAIYVMHREVCLKHRNNRREIILRVRTQVPSWQRCLFFLSYAARVSQPAPPIRGHRSRAGCLSANQAMPVQLRLTAPIFRYPQHGGRQLAQRGLQNLAGSGQHRDAVPLFKSRGSQVGRQRPHKPPTSGFDSRPRHQFHGPLDHSGGHSPRKRESTVQSRGGPPFQNRGKVENQRSLISSHIVVRLHVPQPSRVGSRVKIASRL